MKILPPDVLNMVAAPWRAEFVQLINGDDVSPEFLAYLDSSEPARQACDWILLNDPLGRLLAAAAPEVRP